MFNIINLLLTSGEPFVDDSAHVTIHDDNFVEYILPITLFFLLIVGIIMVIQGNQIIKLSERIKKLEEDHIK